MHSILWGFVKILALVVAGASAFSVTMGAHRLYTHRSFKCNELIKAILVFGQTVAGQVSDFSNSIPVYFLNINVVLCCYLMFSHPRTVCTFGSEITGSITSIVTPMATRTTLHVVSFSLTSDG